MGDIRHNYADLTKIKNKLGFEVQFSFEQGLKQFTNWVDKQEVQQDNYAKSIDVNNVIATKLAIADTAAMLAPYKKMVNELIASNLTSLTADMINNALDSKVNLIDSINLYVTPSQLAAKNFDISPILSTIVRIR